MTWRPFDYSNPTEGLCWLEVERPETWCDASDDGRTVGGYTGQTIRAVVLAEVYGADDGPIFEPIGHGDFGRVRDGDTVCRFLPLAAPPLPPSA